METLPYIFALGRISLGHCESELATLLSLQPPGKDNKSPASGAGCLWELLGGCLWGEADPHQSRSATPSLAPLQRGLEGKSCQPLASSAWLAFGKRITCPREGEGPIAQSPSPSTNTDQPGLSNSSTSLPRLLGPNSHESVSQERKIIQSSIPSLGGVGAGM